MGGWMGKALGYIEVRKLVKKGRLKENMTDGRMDGWGCHSCKKKKMINRRRGTAQKIFRIGEMRMKERNHFLVSWYK